MERIIDSSYVYFKPKEDYFTKDYFKNINILQNIIDKNNNEFNDDFELIEYINSGSCGVVYQAEHKKTKQKVGIKFIFSKILEKKREEQKINRKILNKEVRIQRELKHQNITELLNVRCISDQIPCLVMEYAAYRDLFYFQNNLIKKKSSSETAICYFAKQILDAINYCHKNKLIHMDIKPQNILIDENINLKLADFSVSLSYANNKDKIRLPLAGTSLYMSPEVLRKEEIDVKNAEKIDLYSLGGLLYNFAFTEYPYGLKFADKKEFNTLKNKIEKNALILPKSERFSPLFRNFLSNLLAKDINKRYNLAEAFSDPWIKGAELIFEEKEKIVDLEKFIISLYTDNILSFNDYLKQNSNDSTNSNIQSTSRSTYNEEST